MIEIHANATPFDAGVYLSSCDKGVPGNMMGLARVNIPSVFVPGGTMNAGPEMLTLEQLGMYSAKFERGEIDEEKLDWAKCNACPSCVHAPLSEQHLQCRSWQKHWDLHFRYSTDAIHKSGSSGFCKRSGKTGCKNRTDGKYASF